MDEQNDLDLYDKKELERYGVWVKAGPEDIVEEDEEFVMSDLVSVDDLDIPEADSDPDPFGALSEDDSEEDEFLDLPDLDSELLEEVPEEIPEAPASSQTVAVEEAQQIQNELREIKSELAELRAVLRNVTLPVQENPQTVEPPTPEAPSEVAAEPAPPKGGFFDDTEDETIALTDDELDNILNTAEFTEEAGEAQDLDDDFDELEDSLLPVEEPDSTASDEIDELADMDIDAELAEIESLEDDSPIESPFDEGFDEIELDLTSVEDEITLEEESDSLEEEDDEDFLTLEEDPDDAEFEAFASAVETDISEAPSDNQETELLELEEDLEDLEDFEETVEADEADSEDAVADEVITEEAVSEEVAEEEPVAEDVSPAAPSAPMHRETIIPPPSLDNPNRSSLADLPDSVKDEIRSVLSYMDQLLEALPDDKIEEFAQSEHFGVYKNLFQELGLET